MFHWKEIRNGMKIGGLFSLCSESYEEWGLANVPMVLANCILHAIVWRASG